MPKCKVEVRGGKKKYKRDGKSGHNERKILYGKIRDSTEVVIKSSWS